MKFSRMLAMLLAALATVASAPAMAWGYYGHRTVGEIAWANVKPGTRAAIRRLIAQQAGLDTPACTIRSLADAATWPDCIKRDRWRFDYAFTWHFQDMPVCGVFDIKANCPNGTCVTAQIDRNARLLADRKLAPVLRLQALAFLTHFVGDVHQPLHVGENHDEGANKVKADYGIAGRSNLHSIWDSLEAERAISSARPALVRRYSAAEKARLATGTTADWARESWQISRDFVYPEAFGKLPCDGKEATHVDWSEPKIEAAIPIVNDRIERAGLRLAKMLDTALG